MDAYVDRRPGRRVTWASTRYQLTDAEGSRPKLARYTRVDNMLNGACKVRADVRPTQSIQTYQFTEPTNLEV